jgi:DNA-binding transcriptional ArsR family regulator
MGRLGRRASASSVFDAVADPTRRAILDRLRDGEQPAMALGRPLRVSPSALSQHLAVLRKARLVTRRRAGRVQFYKLRPEPLEEVARWIHFYERFWAGKLANLGKYLEKQR